jgi:hypothetical protein
MKKILCQIIFFLLLVGCTTHYVGPETRIVNEFTVEPGQILLVVKAEKAEYTDAYPYECDLNTCIPHHFWFEYQAKVLDVIQGSYDHTEINFINLQHTYYIDEVTEEWYVLLTKNKGYNNSNFEYVVLKHESKYFWQSNSGT